MKICVIPARGGSKRIHRKNIKPFAGQPVLGYPVQAALASGVFDRVVVSTEDDEIARVAVAMGASVPFKRPAELADDHTGTRAVLLHVINRFEQEGVAIDQLCCLYPVTPFVTAPLLKEAYQAWLFSQASYCMSVAEFPSSPYRALKALPDGRVGSVWPEFRGVRTQDLPNTFYDAGMFYFCDPVALAEKIPIHSDATWPFVLPHHLAHDVDTPEDWALAEAFYRVHGVELNQGG